jgi:16S rRNA (adenine1518-N6/adenine1519-N6)-dimethyltransferase
MSGESTRELLARAGIRPSRRMGQSFLTDPAALDDIAGLALGEPAEWVVELGAGTGNLTGRLLGGGARVLALERDRRLVRVLAERFRDRDGLVVVAGDALSLPLRRLLPAGEVTVAGNIPYHITGEIVRTLGDDFPSVRRAVITVQEEVAARLEAEPGGRDYGAFTILTRARFDVRRARKVPATCFVPRPEVDSAVLLLERPDEPAVKPALYPLVRRLVREAFQRRRKTIVNALEPLFDHLGVRDDVKPAVILAAGLSPDQRPETVALANWVYMAQALRGVIR